MLDLTKIVKRARWVDILIIVLLAISVRLLPTLYYGFVVGDDTWTYIAHLQGREGYSYPVNGLSIHTSSSLPEYPQAFQYFQPYMIIERFVSLFTIYSLGLLWQLPYDLVIFSEIFPSILHALVAIAVYSFTLRISGQRKIALLAAIFNTLTISQLMISRGQIAENLALILMLTSLNCYLRFMEKRNWRYFFLTTALFTSVTFAHILPFIILVTLVLAHQMVNLITHPLRMSSYKELLLTVGLFCIPLILLTILIVLPGVVSGFIYLPSSEGVGPPLVTPYYVIMNYFGVFQLCLAFIGIFVSLKIWNKKYFSLLLTWVFLAFIFPYQYAFGIPIAYPVNRLFLNFHIPFNVFAALAASRTASTRSDNLVLKLNLHSMRAIMRIRFTHIFEILKISLILFCMFSSTFAYITTDAGLNPSAYIPMKPYITIDEYEGIVWLQSNIVADNKTVVIGGDPDFIGYISWLTDFRVYRFAFVHYIDPAQPLELDFNFLHDLSKYFNTIIVCQQLRKMKSLMLPHYFRLIYNNTAVRIFLARVPQTGIYGFVKVEQDEMLTFKQLSYSYVDPSDVMFTMSLSGYTKYSITGFPSFMSYEGVSPTPTLLSIDANSYINFTGKPETPYFITLKGNILYQMVGWKDDSFRDGWFLQVGDGHNNTDGDIFTMTKKFTGGTPDEVYSIYKLFNPNLNASEYSHLLVKLKGDGVAQFVIILYSLSEKRWLSPTSALYPPSDWTVYIYKLTPGIYESVVIRICDSWTDINGTRSVQLDYIMFANYTPLT